jgi:hypothetical protein
MDVKAIAVWPASKVGMGHRTLNTADSDPHTFSQQAGTAVFLVRAVPVIAPGDLRVTLTSQINRVHFDGAVDVKCLDDVVQAANLIEDCIGGVRRSSCGSWGGAGGISFWFRRATGVEKLDFVTSYYGDVKLRKIFQRGFFPPA